MSQSEKKKAGEFVDLSAMFFYYVKYWKWFLLSAVICLAFAFFYLKTTPPIFNTVSNILIKTEDSKSSSMSSAAMKSLGFGGLASSENIEDEVRVISSYTTMRKMVVDLGLYKKYKLKKFPFDQDLYNSSPVTVDVAYATVDTLSAPISLELDVDKIGAAKVKIKYGKNELGKFDVKKFPETLKTTIGDLTLSLNQAAIKKDDYSLKIDVFPLNGMTESYMAQVEVGPGSKKSNVIGLSIKDSDNKRAKDVLDKLISLYNIDALDDKNKMAQNTADFIADRISYISKDLGSIEGSIEDYKKKNNIIDIGAETGMTLGMMNSLQQRFVELEIELSLVKMVEDYVSDPRNKYELIPISSNMPAGIAGVAQDYNGVILERSKLLRSTSESNPAVLLINEQLDLLRKNMNLSIQNVRKGINITKRDWSEKEKMLEGRASNIPRQEREFVEIKRQQQIKAELYIFLLQKLQEAELTLASSTPKAKVIDAAYTNVKPVAPRGMLTLAFALMFGCALPLIILWLRDALRLKLSDITELEKNTSVPILGEICKDKEGRKIVVESGVSTSTAELFRLVRTNLQFVLTNKNEKVILVTSSISGEGKSFFTINLAMSLSLIKDKKVVVVGLDIRNPRLTEYLSLKMKQGITTYLSSDEYAPQDVIFNLPELSPNLSIVPAGPIPPNPSELLLSGRLDSFFEYLRSEFDYILVDTAPVGMVSDTFSLARVSDATIYLYRADYTNKSYLRLAESVVREEKLKKVSLVMNGTTTKTGYGYGYGNKQ